MRQFTKLLLLLLQLTTTCRGFVAFRPLVSSRLALKAVQNTDDMVAMRADIERMREEAVIRLEALNEKLILKTSGQFPLDIEEDHSEEQCLESDNEKTNPPIIASLTAPSSRNAPRKVNLDDAKTMDNLVDIADAFERDMHLLNQKNAKKVAEAAQTNQTPKASDRHPLKLLDQTRWRLMLNVHRVRGTWMPKTWGVSGDQLRLKLEVEFTNEELYEREDYFNGLSDGSKVLKVVHNEALLAPSMKEGGRSIRVLNGGWRVCPGEGPLGTAILRWYFDVEEQVSHLGSDIYLPAGRVYGTCGYFPMIHRSNVDGKGTSKREVFQKELRQMEVKYLSLKSEMDADQNLVSLEKLKCFREMREVRKQAKQVKKTIDEEFIKEPTKDSLRLSRDQAVGLTQEGGICCKKQNGLAQEYHILGKFEIASIENREHSDYKDILRP